MAFLKVTASFLILLVTTSLFSFPLAIRAPFVEAAGQVCCEKTLGDSFCVYTDSSQCDPAYNIASTTCEQTTFCQPACCIDSGDGACYPTVGIAQCLNKVGTSVDVTDLSCQKNPLCWQGCCQLGNQCFLSTENSCALQAGQSPGVDASTAWDGSITDELSCINQCEAQSEGCCVDPHAGCLWTTKDQCDAPEEAGGGFYAGIFCSDSTLACGCVEKSRKGCLPGQEDVYWFDSCGNPEGIVEDCDYVGGTLCKEQGGSAMCASVNCETTVAIPNNPQDQRIGGLRKNGESWCSYESGTGGFYDRPGSRHYRHLCVNGKELVEECKDFREEICVQGDLPIDGTLFSTSGCRPLDAFPKLDLDLYATTKNENVSTIQPHSPSFYDSRKDLVSVMTVDKGSKFWMGDNAQACSKADSECTVVYARKSYLSDYTCEVNCGCETKAHLQQANDYCRAFGDCGADVNILERGTLGGFSARWTGDRVGSRPTTLPSDIFDDLILYGTYGGITSFSTFLESAPVSSPLADVASFGLQAIGSYTAVIAGYALATGSTLYVPFFGLHLVPFGPTGFLLFALSLVAFGDQLGELIGKLLGADTKMKVVHVTCDPWVAPVGGNDCERCGNDVRYNASVYDAPVACSEYRCKSLGTACELANVGTTQQACVATHPNDVAPPQISPWEDALSEGYSAAKTGTGYLIQPDVGYWERISFGILTDEHAQCKIDLVHTDHYENMLQFLGTNLFTTYHNFTVSLPGGRDYTYYARCMDINGNANINEYTIQFSTTDEPDLTPPVIKSTSIASGAYIENVLGQVMLWLHFNEPVQECRWHKETDLDFSLMSNATFLCENDFPDIDDPSALSTSCVGLLDDLRQGAGQDNVYYFRCKDLAGNAMQQGYQFLLRGSDPLSIANSGPGGTLYTPNVTLSVMTRGGAQAGAATCQYQDAAFGFASLPFFVTGGSTHQQPLTGLSMEHHQYLLFCNDVAGNSVGGAVTFRVAVDTRPPIITQLYVAGDALYLATDEKSTCSYHIADPDFTFQKGTVFGVDDTVHVLHASSPVYYIQCNDTFGNLLNGVVVYV